MVGPDLSWKDFVMGIIDCPYFSELKKLRLVSLSHPELMPNKQSILWNNTMIELLDYLLVNESFSENQFMSFNGDEIVIEIHTDKNITDIIGLQLYFQHK